MHDRMQEERRRSENGRHGADLRPLCPAEKRRRQVAAETAGGWPHRDRSKARQQGEGEAGESGHRMRTQQPNRGRQQEQSKGTRAPVASTQSQTTDSGQSRGRRRRHRSINNAGGEKDHRETGINRERMTGKQERKKGKESKTQQQAGGGREKKNKSKANHREKLRNATNPHRLGIPAHAADDRLR